jgi:hypothetical protein
MDGYTECSYLTSGIVITELLGDGYYRIQDGESSDTIYMSPAAVKELVAHFKDKEESDAGNG